MTTNPETPARLMMRDTDWQARLLEICNLKDGWLDGEEGLPMSAEVRDSAWEICKKVDAEDMLRPGIFPTPEGGLQLEWALASGNEYREIIVFTLEPDLSYELHRTRVSDRSYAEFSTPFLCAAFAKLNEWFKEFENSQTV